MKSEFNDDSADDNTLAAVYFSEHRHGHWGNIVRVHGLYCRVKQEYQDSRGNVKHGPIVTVVTVRASMCGTVLRQA